VLLFFLGICYNDYNKPDNYVLVLFINIFFAWSKLRQFFECACVANLAEYKNSAWALNVSSMPQAIGLLGEYSAHQFYNFGWKMPRL